MQRFGLGVNVDVIAQGHRTASDSYGQFYATLLADRPAAGTHHRAGDPDGYPAPPGYDRWPDVAHRHRRRSRRGDPTRSRGHFAKTAAAQSR